MVSRRHEALCCTRLPPRCARSLPLGQEPCRFCWTKAQRRCEGAPRLAKLSNDQREMFEVLGSARYMASIAFR